MADDARRVGCFTLPRWGHASGPSYLIGLHHGLSGRAVSNREDPAYMNGYAAGYEKIRAALQ